MITQSCMLLTNQKRVCLNNHTCCIVKDFCEYRVNGFFGENCDNYFTN